MLNGWIFWLLAALVRKLGIVPAQFDAQQFAVIQIISWGGIAAMLVLQLFPGRRIYHATNLAFVNLGGSAKKRSSVGLAPGHPPSM